MADDLFSSEAENDEVTPRQFTVLSAISADEGLSQKGIVAVTGIDRSTIADIVRRLMDKGMISRRRAKQDARAYEVMLTAKGRLMLASAYRFAAAADARLAAKMTDRQRDDLLRLLEVIARPTTEVVDR